MRIGECKFRNFKVKNFSVIISHEKGDTHAVDHFCHSLNFVATGICQWLHNRRIRSHPAGHRHRRGADSNHSGTQTAIAVWIGSLIREGGAFP